MRLQHYLGGLEGLGPVSTEKEYLLSLGKREYLAFIQL